MGWKIKFPDGPVVDIDDLTPAEFEAIAAAEDDSWWDVYQLPAKTFGRLQRIIEACATHAGIDAPPPPETLREVNNRIDNWLERTTAIEDLPMIDGFPPTPGEPANGSGFGSSGESDGPSTSSSVSESVTS